MSNHATFLGGRWWGYHGCYKLRGSNFQQNVRGGKSLRNNYAQICERNMNARFIFCVLGRWLRRNCFSNLTVTSLVREGCHYCGVGTFISTMEIVSRVTHMNLLCFLCPDDNHTCISRAQISGYASHRYPLIGF